MLSDELRQTAENFLPTTLDALSTLCGDIARAEPNIDLATLVPAATLSAFNDIVTNMVSDSKTRQYIRALQSSKWCLPPWRAYLDLGTLRSRDFMAALNKMTDVLDYPTALRFLDEARDSRQSAPTRGVSKTSDRTAKDVTVALQLSGAPAAIRAPRVTSKKRKRAVVGAGRDEEGKEKLGSGDMTDDEFMAGSNSDSEDGTDEERDSRRNNLQRDDDAKAGANQEVGNHRHMGGGIEAAFDGHDNHDNHGICKKQKTSPDEGESVDRLSNNNDNDLEGDFSNVIEPGSDSEQASPPADHHTGSRTEVASVYPGAFGHASRRPELGLSTPSSCIVSPNQLVRSRPGPFAQVHPTPLRHPLKFAGFPLTPEHTSSTKVGVQARLLSQRGTYPLPASPPATLLKTASQMLSLCEQSRTSEPVGRASKVIEIGDDLENGTPKARSEGLSDRAFDSLQNTRWLSSDAVFGLLLLFNPDPERIFVVDPGLMDGTGIPMMPSTLQECHRKLLFPFCWSDRHWTIGVFDRDRMSTEVYDPLHSPETLRDTAAAIDQMLVCIGAANDARTITQSISKTELKQSNGYDCGIYASVVGIFWMFQTPIPLMIEPSIWRYAGRLALSSVEPHLVLAASEMPAVPPTLPACPPDTTAEEACADVRKYIVANEVVLHNPIESPDYTQISSFASRVAATELDAHTLRQNLCVQLNRELRLREETSRCPSLPVPTKLKKIRAVLAGVEAVKEGLRQERDVASQFVGILKERAKRCSAKEIDSM
ncbi:hypothetical protein TI39_contig4396g00002 [Zymoseptoria brevis]|uniref:Ubiquitin-like protease family profile domain-containing protein n=1 Tax=Zymoseptoria brevis TaxID=1047168 RepID=A0A0F4G6X5_9PEZI|nr:hypothetical protein TI39_contig4396g00002 [Zymoseptoria brevis]